MNIPGCKGCVIQFRLNDEEHWKDITWSPNPIAAKARINATAKLRPEFKLRAIDSEGKEIDLDIVPSV
ncbi:hypothetical protein [Ralstonia phage RP13]|nr:hypothetical protein [Ralstonia phage RP13]